MATKILSDDHFGNLGFYSLGAHYCIFGLCSFASAPVVNKLGNKWPLVIGCASYCLYIASFIPPCLLNENPTGPLKNYHELMYISMMVCASLTGFGGAILWVAQGKYLSMCANPTNKGLFTSIFWAFQISSLVVGNLMAAFVIVLIKESTFFMILLGLCIATAFFFLLLPTPTVNHGEIDP